MGVGVKWVGRGLRAGEREWGVKGFVEKGKGNGGKRFVKRRKVKWEKGICGEG